jgi:uncharacterized damage-inducible protein DinB
MSEQNSMLATIYENWGKYQEHLVKAVAPLAAEQLALSSAPHLRSAGSLAAHIVGTRAGWFNDLMGEGGADIVALIGWGRPGTGVPGSAAVLAAGLEATWRMMQDALARWTPADMEYIYTGTRRGQAYSLSRNWVIWHLIEHDLHHGGELSVTLGMHHIAAIDI